MKILYLTTISDTVNAFLIPHIKMLIEEGHQVDVGCNILQDINQNLIELGCVIHNLPFSRTPIKKQNFEVYNQLRNLIRDEKYDLIHTHTPVASVIGRLACRNNEKIKVFYTAHGFHFFKGAPIKNWLVYYPIEKFLSKYTDVLITINKEDYRRAKNSFKAKRVEYIPGVGLDTGKFKRIEMNKTFKLNELQVPTDAFLILSVGELNDNKNHETIIKAIAKLDNSKIHYMICGQGPLQNKLYDLSKKLGVEKQVKLLGFRNDIAEICKVADVFAFPSKREGLGMAALEAMASGLPIITSNIHGIKDYSMNGITGYNCDANDVEKFKESIQKLLFQNDRKKMGYKNIEIASNYDIEKVLIYLNRIYFSI